MKSKQDRIIRHWLNTEAWCRHFRAPTPEPIGHRHQPLREDRCLIAATPEWLDWLDDETEISAARRSLEDPDGAVHRWTAGIGRHHPFSAIGIDENTAVDGWRGNRTFAAVQIIEHQYHEVHALELDFDLGSPGDLAGTVLHGLEWAYYRLPRLVGRPQRRTNSFLVARWMRRSGIDA